MGFIARYRVAGCTFRFSSHNIVGSLDNTVNYLASSICKLTGDGCHDPANLRSLHTLFRVFASITVSQRHARSADKIPSSDWISVRPCKDSNSILVMYMLVSLSQNCNISIATPTADGPPFQPYTSNSLENQRVPLRSCTLPPRSCTSLPA